MTEVRMTMSGSVLVLERVERPVGAPHRLAGTVSFGGHRFRVVIEVDPRLPGLVETVEAPWLLRLHTPSERAVILAMSRILAGDDVSWPLDLTDDIRDVDPPHPFTPVDPAEETLIEAAADLTTVRVGRVVWPEPGTDPPLVLADLVVDGVPMAVRAWMYAAPGAETKLFWVGEHRPEPTPAQALAISRALSVHRSAR
jgi:hypothetical protein